jgi:hypothetical protein
MSEGDSVLRNLSVKMDTSENAKVAHESVEHYVQILQGDGKESSTDAIKE